MKKSIFLILLGLVCSVGISIGQTYYSDVLFSQDFGSATAVNYVENTAHDLKVGGTGTNASNIVGSSALSQFTSIKNNGKSSCGLGINTTSGQSWSGKFGAVTANTGYYWSICKTSNFATSAPSALQIKMKATFSVASSGSNIGVMFAVGNGFGDGLTNSCPGLTNCVAGFALPSNNTIRVAKYVTSNGNTAINGSSTALTSETEYTYTWVINNTTEPLPYNAPNGKEETVAAGCWDLWVGNTRNLAGVSTAITGMSGTIMQNLYIGQPFGKKSSTFVLDDITVTDLSPKYSRTLTAGQYATICLPKAATYTGATVYNIAGVTKVGDVITGVVLAEEESATLTAGKPYIIYSETASTFEATYSGTAYSAASAGEAYAPTATGLVGNLSPDKAAVEDGMYILLYQDDAYKVCKVDGADVTCAQYRAYFDLGAVATVGGASAPGQRIIEMVNENNNATNLGNFESSEEAVKFFQNGKLFIKKNGIVYDMMGTIVK